MAFAAINPALRAFYAFCPCPDPACNCGQLRLSTPCPECQAGDHVYVPSEAL